VYFFMTESVSITLMASVEKVEPTEIQHTQVLFHIAQRIAQLVEAVRAAVVVVQVQALQI
jgi:hypothetical protein